MSDRTIFKGFLGRKILVTGAAGFIGSHLVERLAELGCAVTAAGSAASFALENLASTRSNVATKIVDLAIDDLEAFLAAERFDLIFHLSASASVATSIEDPRDDLKGNILTTFNLLEAVRQTSRETAVVFTSSAMVYEGRGKIAISEEGQIGPRSPYGVSKLAAERYVSIYAKLYGMKTGVLRLFSVFGPRLCKQVVHDLMGRLIDNPVSLTIKGSGQENRDLSYIDDVVDAILAVANGAPLEGETYNIASGAYVSTMTLARLISTAMGLHPEIRFSGGVKAGDTPHLNADTTRLRALGHVPRVSLADGLKRTWEWRKQTIDTPESGKLAQ